MKRRDFLLRSTAVAAVAGVPFGVALLQRGSLLDDPQAWIGTEFELPDGVRLFVPMMLEAAAQDPSYRGHVTNTASMAGLLTPPNMGIYNAAKAAVVSLTETMYQDLRLVTDQIGASLLCPYFVPTGIAASERNRPGGAAAEKPTRSQLIGKAMSEKAVSSGLSHRSSTCHAARLASAAGSSGLVGTSVGKMRAPALYESSGNGAS